MQKSDSSNISFHIAKPTNRNTKYFVYGKKQYAIDFNSLKNNCNYFYQNRKLYKDKECINLIDPEDDGNVELSEESILTFISACQNDKCELKISTVIPLRYLAYKFEYPELKQITDDYVQKNSKQLVIQNLLFNKNDEKLEENIASNFDQYINDDKILQLPISTVDRIFQNFKKKSKAKQNIQINEITKFLFKCLDKYGKVASVLFNDFDFQGENVDVINRLLNKYSDVFDFNMINSTLAKTTLELTSDLTKQKEQFSKFFDEMKSQFEKQKLEVIKLRDEEKKARIEEEKRYKLKFEEYERNIDIFTSKIDQRMKSIENDFQNISQRYERNIGNGTIVKYHCTFLETLELSEFNKLSDQSKQHIIVGINENENILNNVNSKLIKKILCLSNYFKILSTKNSNDNIDPLYESNQQELFKFVLSKLNESTINLDDDIIQYLSQKKGIEKIIIDLLNNFNQSFIEITYPMASFKSSAKFLSNIENEISQMSSKTIFTLTVNENPKAEEMNDIKTVINILKIKSGVKEIDDGAFMNFSKLSKIEFTNGIKAIGIDSFKNCKLLSQISIPTTVTSIGDNAFEGCTSLTEISIPTTVTSIGDNAFKGCTSLTEISIPASVKSIGKSIFQGIKTIKLSKDMTQIPSNLFNRCTSLTQISIPTTVTSIGDNAFEGCTSLTEISIPTTVTSIGDNAFEGCTSLTEISIPASVTSIGKLAFKGCPASFAAFAYRNGGELNGIIRCLTDKTGGNIHDNGTISISASSTYIGRGGNYNPKFVCNFNDLSSKSSWSPKNEQGATLTFDFKNNAVKITDYSLHTKSDSTVDAPRSWDVECSNDNNQWFSVDSRKDEQIMNNKNVCHTFKCKSPTNEFYRYIRLKVTGESWSNNNNYYFDISAVEFFGIFKDKSQ